MANYRLKSKASGEQRHAFHGPLPSHAGFLSPALAIQHGAPPQKLQFPAIYLLRKSAGQIRSWVLAAVVPQWVTHSPPSTLPQHTAPRRSSINLCSPSCVSASCRILSCGFVSVTKPDTIFAVSSLPSLIEKSNFTGSNSNIWISPLNSVSGGCPCFRDPLNFRSMILKESTKSSAWLRSHVPKSKLQHPCPGRVAPQLT